MFRLYRVQSSFYETEGGKIVKSKRLFIAFIFGIVTILAMGIAACGGSTNDGGSAHAHPLTHCEGVAATCTEPGTIEYWNCSYCNVKFADEEGTTEITDITAPPLGHTGGTATCTELAVCTRCNVQYGQLTAHTCGQFEETKAPSCTEAGERAAICSVCHQTISEEIPATGHSGEWYVVAEPRCLDDGERQRVCTVCNNLEEEVIPAYGGHDLQDSTCAAGKVCSRCNYFEGTGRGHAFGEWQTVTESTCTEKGLSERTCLVCGQTETHDIAMTGHSGEWGVVTAPTCTQNGTEDRYCEVCGAYETRTAYKTGHSGEWVVTKPMNCTTNGEEQRVCEVCGTLERKTIYKSHLAFGDWYVVEEPTCTTYGIRERYCSACGKTERSNISKTGHSMEWEVITEATCTQEGVRLGTCSVCGQQENDVIKALGHSLQGGTCAEPVQCTRCGEYQYIEHKYDEPIEIYPPDCEREGRILSRCTVCGEERWETLYPTNHKYGESVAIVPVTCTEDGIERRVCEVCGKAVDNVVVKHHNEEVIVVIEPTCTENGLEQRVCAACHQLFGQTVIPVLGHEMTPATCFEPGVCTRCSYTDGKCLDHQTYGTCSYCGFSNSTILNMVLGSTGDYYMVYNEWSYDDYLPDKLWIPEKYNGKPVKTIAFDAFTGCEFTEIYLPGTIQEIGMTAFFNCSSLTTVRFGNNSQLKQIRDNAFYNCTSLTSIYIPDSVTYIGDNAFYNCSNLTIYCEYSAKPTEWSNSWNSSNCPVVWGYEQQQEEEPDPGEEPDYIVVDDIRYLLNDGVATVTRQTQALSGDIVIPCEIVYDQATYQVTAIADYAFFSCEDITSVVIPDSVTVLGTGAFNTCRGLMSVEIPHSITVISDYAFYYCSALRNLEIPDSVTSIGAYAFCDCYYLTSLVIPDSVITLGNGAFSSCGNLTSVVFSGGVTTIGEDAFSGCIGLSEVILPDSLKVIGARAFFESSDLLSIKIPDGVTTIGEEAFAVSGIRSIVLPGSITAIGKNVYNGKLSSDIFFVGTEHEWNEIDIDPDNYHFSMARVIFYSESQPAGSGYFWHYVDGVPAIW